MVICADVDALQGETGDLLAGLVDPDEADDVLAGDGQPERRHEDHQQGVGAGSPGQLAVHHELHQHAEHRAHQGADDQRQPERQAPRLPHLGGDVGGQGVGERVGEVEAPGDEQDAAEAHPQEAVGAPVDHPVDGELLSLSAGHVRGSGQTEAGAADVEIGLRVLVAVLVLDQRHGPLGHRVGDRLNARVPAVVALPP